MRPQTMLRAIALLGIALSFVLLSVKPLLAGESVRKFKVGGFDCEMCPKMAEKAVKKIEGVKEAVVILDDNKDPKKGGTLQVTALDTVSDDQIISAVKKAQKGFTCERLPQ